MLTDLRIVQKVMYVKQKLLKKSKPWPKFKLQGLIFIAQVIELAIWPVTGQKTSICDISSFDL